MTDEEMKEKLRTIERNAAGIAGEMFKGGDRTYMARQIRRLGKMIAELATILREDMEL